jgi:hypothetical protein
MFSKDAMADVVIEIVESKKDEIANKALEQLESKKEEISEKAEELANKAEQSIETTVEDAGKKIEDTVNSIIDKIDDNPQIAKAVDVVENIIGDQLDGREVSCSCFGFLWLLRITRKNNRSAPSKSEESPNKPLPEPTRSAHTSESPQTSSPEKPQTDSASQE